jgi:hypothetical protein
MAKAVRLPRGSGDGLTYGAGLTYRAAGLAVPDATSVQWIEVSATRPALVLDICCKGHRIALPREFPMTGRFCRRSQKEAFSPISTSRRMGEISRV